MFSEDFSLAAMSTHTSWKYYKNCVWTIIAWALLSESLTWDDMMSGWESAAGPNLWLTEPSGQWPGSVATSGQPLSSFFSTLPTVGQGPEAADTPPPPTVSHTGLCHTTHIGSLYTAPRERHHCSCADNCPPELDLVSGHRPQVTGGGWHHAQCEAAGRAPTAHQILIRSRSRSERPSGISILAERLPGAGTKVHISAGPRAGPTQDRPQLGHKGKPSTFKT